jgi:tol-pal system protein YbgF
LTRWRRYGAKPAIAAIIASLCAWGADAQTLDSSAAGRQTFIQVAQLSPPADIAGQGDANADPGDAASLLLRVDRLEEQLRQAYGQIEELQNQQSRLEEQLKKFREDVEYRLGDHSGAAATPSAPAPIAEAAPAVKPARKSDVFDPSTMPNAPGAPQPLGTTTASAPLRNSTLAGAPLDLSSRPPPPAPVVAPAAVSGTGIGLVDGPREQYNAALQDYQNGQYERSEEEFKAFLAANSGHRLAPEAIFFLGETYLQRSRPREAAEQYLRVSTDYGKSARAPESMVRLGQSLAALGNNEQACATFGEFNRRYPTALTSIKKLAEREMQKDHC